MEHHNAKEELSSFSDMQPLLNEVLKTQLVILEDQFTQVQTALRDLQQQIALLDPLLKKDT